MKARDVAQQRQAMKNTGEATPAPQAEEKGGGKKGGRKPGRKTESISAHGGVAQPTAQGGPVNLIEKPWIWPSSAAGSWC